jgi:predicted RNA binding protein YcfA (HicA-like mRNA interferase family)
MGNPEEEFERMRHHRVGWRFSDVERILRCNGFEKKNQTGSDRVYKHEASGVRYFISWRGSGPVKPGYIKELVKQVDASKEKP